VFARVQSERFQYSRGFVYFFTAPRQGCQTPSLPPLNDGCIRDEKQSRWRKGIIADGIKSGAPPLPLYLSLAEAGQKAGKPDEVKAALKSAKSEVEKAIKDGNSAYILYDLIYSVR
jgi:hypothetical protein